MLTNKNSYEYDYVTHQKIKKEKGSHYHYGTTELIIILNIDYDDLIYQLEKDPDLEVFI